MQRSIHPSLTPLWRTKAFPSPAQSPADAQAIEHRSADRGHDLHFVNSLATQVAPVKSVGDHLSEHGQGRAERHARRVEEIAWLSQIADARHAERQALGAHLLQAHFACSYVQDWLARGSNALHDAQLKPHRLPLVQMQAYHGLHGIALQAVANEKMHSQTVQGADGRQVVQVSLADYARCAEVAVRHFGYGNCTLQAAAAWAYLRRHVSEHTCVDLCEVQDVDHVLVVIGRRPGSDPKNMDDWGPQAVVCDPWAGLVYPLSSYREMQRPEHDRKRHVGESGGHYLRGRLVVMEGRVGLN